MDVVGPGDEQWISELSCVLFPAAGFILNYVTGDLGIDVTFGSHVFSLADFEARVHYRTTKEATYPLSCRRGGQAVIVASVEDRGPLSTASKSYLGCLRNGVEYVHVVSFIDSLDSTGILLKDLRPSLKNRRAA